MKTQYRTAFWADKDRLELINDLKEYGIFLKLNKFEAVEFYNDDEKFESIKNLFEKNNIDLEKKSIYTTEERLISKYLGVQSSWHYGYPQPEDDYKELCFDLRNYCSECGIGAKQLSPLRMTGEPKWGRRQMLQLNWIFDEYFVKPETYNKIFKPLGIRFKNVIHNKKNVVLQTVLQLDIPVIESELIMEKYPFERCTNCNKKKYLPITIGGYPKLKKDTSLPIFKSLEYFGSGARTYRMVFINNKLYRELENSKIRGVSYVPVFEK